MELKRRISFTSHSMFPDQKDQPSEDIALSIYSANLNLVNQYATERGLILDDKETSNVNEEMCWRKIAFFAYGYEHSVQPLIEKQQPPFKFSARIEAFYYRDYSKYGSLDFCIRGDPDLIQRVENAMKDINPLGSTEKRDIIARFMKGKQECYGHCKR